MQFLLYTCQARTHSKDNKNYSPIFSNEYKLKRRAALVPRLPLLTPLLPLLCVHPHKHMLPCIAVLWRTQSTSYPQLSLVTVSGLCGRTGSDRMDCCVIDFNLESAACCFFPPFFHSWVPAGHQPLPTSEGSPWLHCYRKHIKTGS